MIEDCHFKHPNIACWSKDGSEVIIKNKDRLGREILPMFFKHKHGKCTSLFRQFNFYSFEKISSKTSTIIIYRHKYFHRRRPDLLIKIKRKTDRGMLNSQMPQVREGMKKVNKDIKKLKGNLQQAFETSESKLDKRIQELESCLKRKAKRYPEEYKPIPPPVPNINRFSSILSLPTLGDFDLERQTSAEIVDGILAELPGMKKFELTRQESCTSTAFFDDFAQTWS